MNILQLIYLITGVETSLTPKHDLRKKVPLRERILKRLNKAIERNFYLIIALVMLIVLVVFIWTCFAIVGFGVESGNYYYHFNKVI